MTADAAHIYGLPSTRNQSFALHAPSAAQCRVDCAKVGAEMAAKLTARSAEQATDVRPTDLQNYPGAYLAISTCCRLVSGWFR